MRIHTLSILTFVGLLLGLVGYLFYIDRSGTLVASGELWSQDHNTDMKAMADDMVKGYAISSKDAGIKWLESKPLHLSASSGPLHFELLETESGFTQKRGRNFGGINNSREQVRDMVPNQKIKAEFFLKHLPDQKEIFHQPRQQIGASSGSSFGRNKASAITLGVRESRYRITTAAVPEDGDYVLTAGIDPYFFASSKQTVVVNAFAGKKDFDPMIVMSCAVLIVLNMVVLIMMAKNQQNKNQTKEWKES